MQTSGSSRKILWGIIAFLVAYLVWTRIVPEEIRNSIVRTDNATQPTSAPAAFIPQFPWIPVPENSKQTTASASGECAIYSIASGKVEQRAKEPIDATVIKAYCTQATPQEVKVVSLNGKVTANIEQKSGPGYALTWKPRLESIVGQQIKYAVIGVDLKEISSGEAEVTTTDFCKGLTNDTVCIYIDPDGQAQYFDVKAFTFDQDSSQAFIPEFPWMPKQLGPAPITESVGECAIYTPKAEGLEIRKKETFNAQIMQTYCDSATSLEVIVASFGKQSVGSIHGRSGQKYSSEWRERLTRLKGKQIQWKVIGVHLQEISSGTGEVTTTDFCRGLTNDTVCIYIDPAGQAEYIDVKTITSKEVIYVTPEGR